MANIYDYKPSDDLTVQELSTIMEILFNSLINGIQGNPTAKVETLQVDAGVYSLLPASVHRHFTKSVDRDHQIVDAE